MDSATVTNAVKLWAGMHKDYINFENIDDAGYCITLSVTPKKHLFQIFCQQDSWKPMFVVSEDPALSDWLTTINKYIQMFTNGVNIEQFVAELEKTLTKIFPKSAVNSATEPKVNIAAPQFKLPDNILPNIEFISNSTAEKIQSTSGSVTTGASVGTNNEQKPIQQDDGSGKDIENIRSQIMKWIGENTYVNVTLESIQSTFEVELSIGFPKIKFKILFTNEWKPMIVTSESPFLGEYLAPANIFLEDRMQSGEPMSLNELMNMFALAYNEGQQQFQEQLNQENKPMVDVGEPINAVNLENSAEIAPPQPEPDVPPEVPTEEDWIKIIFPSVRRHLETDNFQPWEVEEWIRRVDKARHSSNDEGVRLIRSEILGGGQAPAEIARFIPKWKYLFGPNAINAANNATEADPNNIRYKYNTKEGGEEATKRLIEEIEQLTAMGDTKTSLGFVAKPIGKNLFQWSVNLTGFKSDSVLGQDLIEYALKHRSQKQFDENATIEPSDILFEVKFPADYPNSPPLFRLVRPRLIVPDNVDFGFEPVASNNNNNNTVANTNQPTTNATTFSEFEKQKTALNKGKHPLSMSIQIERHSSNAWNPQLRIVDLVKRIRNVLETGNIRVDNMTSTKEGLPTVGSFWKTYRCISSKNIGRSDADQGGKIFLPTSCVELLYGEQDTPSWRGGFRHMDDESDDDSMDLDASTPNGPMVFEISSRSGKRSFVGVLEFTAPEGYAALPTWMMENLMVKESDPLQIRRVKLPRGQFLKLQPHSDKFYEVGNAKAMLEWVLRDFNALASGDTIHVMHDRKEYKFDVVHVEPGQAIAITDSDLKVDFTEPLEGSKDTGKSQFANDNKPATKPNSGVSMSTELHRDGLLSSVEMNRYDDEEEKELKKKKAAQELVGSAIGRLQTGETDVEGVNFKTCETCRQKIPMASYTMHSISCPRINWFCDRCHTVVKKTERQAHLDTAHAVVVCPECHERVEQFQFDAHKKDACQMRAVHCQYCELKIRFKERWDHERACGAVTELCEKCKRRVPRSELVVHESACTGSGVLSSSPSTGFTFGSTPPNKFTPPTFQRRNSVYLCDKCQHPCEGFDELQVHMLTVHDGDNNMVDVDVPVPETFEEKKDEETMQM